jgi:hypothetical protein
MTERHDQDPHNPSVDEVGRWLDELDRDPDQWEGEAGARLARLVEHQADAPSDRLRARFYQALSDYERARAGSISARVSVWLASWWPTTPALQLAASALALLLGVGLGVLFSGQQRGREVAALEGEVRAMSRMLTLTLFQSPSASERLRAVSISEQALEDREVLSALLDVVSYDPSENVRLAALDAISSLVDRPGVAQSLAQSLPRQFSPMLQVAVGDVLATAQPSVSQPAIEQLLAAPDVDEAVRARFAELSQQLGRSM